MRADRAEPVAVPPGAVIPGSGRRSRVSVTIAGILASVRASGAGTRPETLTYLGLLLERHARKR